MNRRNFLTLSCAAGSLSFLSAPVMGQNAKRSYAMPILAAPLKPGDTIGLVAPSSAVSRIQFQRTLENLQSLGLNPIYSDNIRVKKGFLAGTDAQRIDDLHRMFEDPNTKAVICARGGYGAQRLLPHLDYELIRKNPKIFVGYSDITALHLAISQKTGLVCFHGPNGDSNFSPFSMDRYKTLLFENEGSYTLQAGNELLRPEYKSKGYTLRPGKAKGILVGGNLTLISTLMGTPFQPDFQDRIVFLEDIGEAPYRIDRMLTQLLLSGALENAAGIALGIFHDCEADPQDPDYPDSLSLDEVLKDRLGSLGIPIVCGLPFGHIEDNGILPYGIEVALDAKALKIELKQPALS